MHKPINEILDFSDEKWNKYIFLTSMKAFDIYAEVDEEDRVLCRYNLVNETYAVVGDSEEEAMSAFIKIMDGLDAKAVGKKLECRDIGEGRLVFQCRRDVQIETKDEKVTVSWRGIVDKIPNECNVRLDHF